jgi:hypothetical protein
VAIQRISEGREKQAKTFTPSRTNPHEIAGKAQKKKQRDLAITPLGILRQSEADS